MIDKDYVDNLLVHQIDRSNKAARGGDNWFEELHAGIGVDLGGVGEVISQYVVQNMLLLNHPNDPAMLLSGIAAMCLRFFELGVQSGRDPANALPVCDECGEAIQNIGTSLDNKHHAESCSLYNPA